MWVFIVFNQVKKSPKTTQKPSGRKPRCTASYRTVFCNCSVPGRPGWARGRPGTQHLGSTGWGPGRPGPLCTRSTGLGPGRPGQLQGWVFLVFFPFASTCLRTLGGILVNLFETCLRTLRGILVKLFETYLRTLGGILVNLLRLIGLLVRTC